MVVRIENYSATPQVGGSSFKHYMDMHMYLISR
jgi:hypothetical protein